MELTGIGRENEQAFLPLMPGLKSDDYVLCVGAIEEDMAAGVALYSELDGSLILDYIYVHEKFRRRGIGTALIEDTLKELYSAGLISLHVNYPESAADIHAFILSRGFKVFRDGVAYRAKIGDFLESSATKKLFAGPLRNRVARISGLSEEERGILRKALEDNELDPSIIDDRSFSKELSLTNFRPENGKPGGMVLCRASSEVVTVSYLVNFSNDAVQLWELLKAFVLTVEKMGIGERELVFLTMNDDMVKLPEKLLQSPDLLKKDGAVISGIRMLLPERTFFADTIRERMS